MPTNLRCAASLAADNSVSSVPARPGGLQQPHRQLQHHQRCHYIRGDRPEVCAGEEGEQRGQHPVSGGRSGKRAKGVALACFMVSFCCQVATSPVARDLASHLQMCASRSVTHPRKYGLLLYGQSKHKILLYSFSAPVVVYLSR